MDILDAFLTLFPSLPKLVFHSGVAVVTAVNQAFKLQVSATAGIHPPGLRAVFGHLDRGTSLYRIQHA